MRKVIEKAEEVGVEIWTVEVEVRRLPTEENP